ncbi:MAG: hypothetical protein ACO1NO_00620 [Burkholderiaceae bacterium]
MATPSFTRDFLRLFSGPIVWAVHFLFVYGFTGVLCARPGWQAQWLGIGMHEWGIGLASLAALILLALIHIGIWRRQSVQANATFVVRTGAALALLSSLAIIWESLPLLLVPACA